MELILFLIGWIIAELFPPKLNITVIELPKKEVKNEHRI